jgi:protein-S-isoprenylcysteine O-methyltransferase Ste14
MPILTILRHLLSIAALPFTVAVLIPIWIARQNGVAPTLPTAPIEWLLLIAAVASLAVGLTLFTASLKRFATEGEGTLAPWDPPRRLVVTGPYRFVRNPMISGVMFILFGEALALRSTPHAAWAVTFLVINAIYIPLLEEPMLTARFGEPYREYRRHVRRFWPRVRPWLG